MILNAVNQFLGMLRTHAQGETLGFECNAFAV